MKNIYKITNLITNKIYVGQTKFSIEERLNQHINCSKEIKENGDSLVLHNSIHKYGKDNFIVELIETVDETIADEREIFWISELNSMIPNGYNMTIGGNGTIGYKFNDEDRKKISIAGKNWWSKFSKEQRRIMRKPFLEMCKKPKTEEHKRKVSETRIANKIASGENNPFYGKHHSEETKKHLAQIKYKPVICIHDDNTEEYFESLLSAGDEMIRRGFKSGNHYIWMCLKGYQNKAYGYRWKYAEKQ